MIDRLIEYQWESSTCRYRLYATSRSSRQQTDPIPRRKISSSITDIDLEIPRPKQPCQQCQKSLTINVSRIKRLDRWHYLDGVVQKAGWVYSVRRLME